MRELAGDYEQRHVATGKTPRAHELKTIRLASQNVIVGLAAVAMWFSGRRSAAYTVALPPLVLVLVSAWLFPFSGVEPMATASLIRTGL